MMTRLRLPALRTVSAVTFGAALAIGAAAAQTQNPASSAPAQSAPKDLGSQFKEMGQQMLQPQQSSTAPGGAAGEKTTQPASAGDAEGTGRAASGRELEQPAKSEAGKDAVATGTGKAESDKELEQPARAEAGKGTTGPGKELEQPAKAEAAKPAEPTVLERAVQGKAPSGSDAIKMLGTPSGQK